jgi:hypothetical protein
MYLTSLQKSREISKRRWSNEEKWFKNKRKKLEKLNWLKLWMTRNANDPK